MTPLVLSSTSSRLHPSHPYSGDPGDVEILSESGGVKSNRIACFPFRLLLLGVTDIGDDGEMDPLFLD